MHTCREGGAGLAVRVRPPPARALLPLVFFLCWFGRVFACRTSGISIRTRLCASVYLLRLLGLLHLKSNKRWVAYQSSPHLVILNQKHYTLP